MSKLLALVCLLSLIGGSLSTTVILGIYEDPLCSGSTYVNSILIDDAGTSADTLTAGASVACYISSSKKLYARCTSCSSSTHVGCTDTLTFTTIGACQEDTTNSDPYYYMVTDTSTNQDPFYVALYSSATPSQETYLDSEQLVGMSSGYCQLLDDQVSWGSLTLATSTTATVKLYCTDGTCSTGCTTFSTAITINADPTLQNDVYIQVSTQNPQPSIYDPFVFVSTYSSSACDSSDYVSEAILNYDSAPQQVGSTDTTFAAVNFDQTTYTLYYGCTQVAPADADDTQTASLLTSCDANGVTVTLDGSCVAGSSTVYYQLTSKSVAEGAEPAGSSILSVASVALFALIALLL